MMITVDARDLWEVLWIRIRGEFDEDAFANDGESIFIVQTEIDEETRVMYDTHLRPVFPQLPPSIDWLASLAHDEIRDPDDHTTWHNGYKLRGAEILRILSSAEKQGCGVLRKYYTSSGFGEDAEKKLTTDNTDWFRSSRPRHWLRLTPQGLVPPPTATTTTTTEEMCAGEAVHRYLQRQWGEQHAAYR